MIGKVWKATGTVSRLIGVAWDGGFPEDREMIVAEMMEPSSGPVGYSNQ